jgi:hypothetical protein
MAHIRLSTLHLFQVPQFLLDDPTTGLTLRMAVTQPRRISAIAVVRKYIYMCVCVYTCIYPTWYVCYADHHYHSLTPTNQPINSSISQSINPTTPIGGARGRRALRGRGQGRGLQHPVGVPDLGPDPGKYIYIYYNVLYYSLFVWMGCVRAFEMAPHPPSFVHQHPTPNQLIYIITYTSSGGVHDPRRAPPQAGQRPGAAGVLPRHDR